MRAFFVLTRFASYVTVRFNRTTRVKYVAMFVYQDAAIKSENDEADYLNRVSNRYKTMPLTDYCCAINKENGPILLHIQTFLTIKR